MAGNTGLRNEAREVFERWLLRREEGAGEAFEEFLARHQTLRVELESLWQAYRELQATLARDEVKRWSPARKRLGDFELRREIGRGGMGIVFAAEQVSLGREVAIKVLPAHLTLSERALARFQREAAITARLHHPNIIDIHQIGEEEGVSFIAMELIDGASLDRLLDRLRGEAFEHVRKRPLGDVVSLHGLHDEAIEASAPERPSEGRASRKGSSWASNKSYIESAVKVVRQVADALDHAHQAGVIHRDVKPSNILVRGDGSAVLTDFGLARDQGLPSVSHTGEFAGTPNYVSPEQAMAGRVPVDHRADVFSLGATLYELLTLEQAFPGENSHEVLSRILTKPPRDPQKLNPSLAPDLVTIVLKALEKDPDRRYQTCGELAEDLTAFVEYRPIRAKRTGTVVRAWRWVRRKPTQAALGVVLAAGLPSITVLGAQLLWSRGRIEELLPITLQPRLESAYFQLGQGNAAEAATSFGEILESSPDSLEARVGNALALRSLGKSAEALERNEAARAPVLDRLRVHLLRDLGRDAEAEELRARLPSPGTALERYLEALLLLDRTPHRADSKRDTLRQYRSNAEEAAGLLEKAIRIGPPLAIYHFAQAWASWAAGDDSGARASEEALLELASERAAEGDRSVFWYYIGIAREVFDREGAARAYEQAASLGLAAARRREATLFLVEEPQRGLELLEQLAEDEPRNAGVRANLAVAYLATGRLADAERACREAIALEPEMVEAWDTLGNATYGQGRYEDAREAYEAALRIEPSGARLHNDLGMTLLALGDLAVAGRELDRAVELAPGQPVLLFNRANAALGRGELASAEDDLRAAVDLLEASAAGGRAILDGAEILAEEGVTPGTTRGKLALVLGQQGRLDEGVELLQVAVRLEPADARHRTLLTQALLTLGRFEELREALMDWTRFDPRNADAWNALAWLLVDPEGSLLVRDPDAALECARKAVELEERPEYLDTLAWALFASGDASSALEQERRALELATGAGEPEDLVGALRRSLAAFQDEGGD